MENFYAGDKYISNFNQIINTDNYIILNNIYCNIMLVLLGTVNIGVNIK